VEPTVLGLSRRCKLIHPELERTSSQPRYLSMEMPYELYAVALIVLILTRSHRLLQVIPRSSSLSNFLLVQHVLVVLTRIFASPPSLPPQVSATASWSHKVAKRRMVRRMTRREMTRVMTRNTVRKGAQITKAPNGIVSLVLFCTWHLTNFLSRVFSSVVQA
jgi:hypothetical protein